MLDLDQWLAEHQPWAIKLGGRVYSSRPVSVLLVQWFETAMRAAGDHPGKARTVLRQFWRQVFPWRWRYLPHGDPVRHLMALDDAVQQVVLADFFEAVAKRLQTRLTPTTRGNGSATKTASPTSELAPVGSG